VRLPSLLFGAALPALNLFGVRKSKVANEARENPKNFVKPLIGSHVLLLCNGKPGATTCRWRIMCLTELITIRCTRIGTSRTLKQNCLSGSQPNDVCAIILKKLIYSVGREICGDVGLWV